MNRALAIETSCDETSVALGEFSSEGTLALLSEKTSSQDPIHSQYGGVVPELASREHLRALPLLLDEVLREGRSSLADLSFIAVTVGPGLKGCLLMGSGFAKGLALAAQVPLLGINHLEGHLAAGLLDNPDLEFPFLALLVSGGHTELVFAEKFGRYQSLAATLDDAAGEAFDKAANLLGLDYPGGAKLAGLADAADASEFRFPIALKGSADFSFSGLKTAVMLAVTRNRERLEADIRLRGELARAVQDAVVAQLVARTKRAVGECAVTRLLVTGGVAANRELRRQLTAQLPVKVFFPQQKHCTDNAAMILQAAVKRFIAGERESPFPSVRPRWPLADLSL